MVNWMNSVIQQSPPSARRDCPSEGSLRRFLSSELEDASESAIAPHVDSCRRCQEKLDSFYQSSESYHEVDQLTSDDFGTHPTRTSDGEFVQRFVASLCDNVSDFMKRWKPENDTAAPVIFKGPVTTDAPLGRLDRFEILNHVGSGATGHLYRAWDPQLCRHVAIKVLRQDQAALESARHRFAREAHAAAQFQSKHIAAIHEVHTPEDFPPWLVLEFIDGESLYEQIQRDGSVTPERAAVAVVQILDALTAAHAGGVIHRDVKPSNVLVESGSQALKLVDFGLARLTEAASELTADGVIAGTPAYMSPEQILNPTDVDVRADIYSTGVVLYELLTGERPFRGAVRSLLQDVLHSDPQRVRRLDDRIPRDLENICHKAIAREKHRRYQTAEDFRNDLTRFLNGEPVVARSVTLIERVTLWSRRNPVVAALLTVTCVTVLGALSGWASFTLKLTEKNDELADTIHSLQTSNADLLVAERQAVLSEQRTQQHANVAQEQINVAFDMISALVFEVQNELGETPGTEKLRERLLNRAIDGLQRVRSSAANTVSADVGMIMARNRLGDSLKALDQPDAAWAQYELAFDDAKKLQKQFPKNELILSAAAICAWNMGDAMLAAGEFDVAIKTYECGLGFVRKWQAVHPDSLEPRLNLAMGQQRLAAVSQQVGDLNGAEQKLNECVSCLHLGVKELESAELRLALGQALLKLGRVQQGTDHVAALQTCRNAHDRLNQIDVGSESPDFVQRVQFAIGLTALELANASDDAVDAEKFARQASQAFSRHPNQYYEQIVAANSLLAVALVKLDRSDEALTLLRSDAVAVLESKSLSAGTRLSNALALLAAEVAEGNHKSASDSVAAIRELLTIAAKSNDSIWLNKQRRQFEILQEHLSSLTNRSSK